MKAGLFISLLLCVASLRAERPNVTKATGSVLRGKNSVITGPGSRAQLDLPFLVIIRVGSNANLQFAASGEMILNSGTLLVSSPKSAGGQTVKAGAITAATKGATFEMANVAGSAKAICLNGKVVIALTANPAQRTGLRPGQMVDVAAGATKMPAASSVDLKTLMSTSGLMQMGPLPGQRAIERNANQQAPRVAPFVSKIASDTPPPPLIATTRAAAAAQSARIITQASTVITPPPVAFAPAPVQLATSVAPVQPAAPVQAPAPIQPAAVVQVLEALVRRGRADVTITPPVQPPQPATPPVSSAPSSPPASSTQPVPVPRPPIVIERPGRPPIFVTPQPPIAGPRPTPRPPIAVP